MNKVVQQVRWCSSTERRVGLAASQAANSFFLRRTAVSCFSLLQKGWSSSTVSSANFIDAAAREDQAQGVTEEGDRKEESWEALNPISASGMQLHRRAREVFAQVDERAPKGSEAGETEAGCKGEKEDA